MANDSSAKLYQVACLEGHSRSLTATELESLIRAGEFECDHCACELSLMEPNELILECRTCSDVFEVTGLEQAMHTSESDCPSCEHRGIGDKSVHVPRSWQSLEGTYDWMRSGKDVNPLRRPGRDDYWEGVIHFCSAAEFAQIQKAGRIRASPTGYFNLPAVCLSEATEGGWSELRDMHGSFGFVFHKSALLSIGGGPAVYLNPAVLAAQQRIGFAEQARPFVNLLRTRANAPGQRRHDYLHEREWRTPADIDLRATGPYAVIKGEFDIATPEWEHIFGALIQYEELNVDQED